eukprot:5219829-Amphidinium_carterae.2
MAAALFDLAFCWISENTPLTSAQVSPDSARGHALETYHALPTFVHPNSSPEAWRPVLAMSEQDMGNRALREPSMESQVYKQVADLVPWQLTRVQINRLSKVHRHAAEPHTHRLSVLHHDDDDDVVI